MTTQAPGWSTRVLGASILGGVWIGICDGIGLALAEGIETPGAAGVTVAFGAALLTGAICGLLLAGVVRLAGIPGPARKLTAGALRAVGETRLLALALAVLGLVLVLGLAVPARAALLTHPAAGAAIDVAACAIGWGLFVLLQRKLGRRPGRTMGRRLGAWLLVALGALGGLGGTLLRAALVPSGLWDLWLIGAGVLLAGGLALLLPSSRRFRRGVAAALALSLLGGFGAAGVLNASDDVRDEVGSDWRPASWIVEHVSTAVDFDRDGFSPLFGGGDCDDSNPDVNPEGIEIAGNGLDENCRDGDRPLEPPWPPRPTFVPLPQGLEEPRSIVMVVVDTMRHDHMGVYGYHRNTTPRMDAFAHQGVRFDLGYSVAPTTRIALPTLHTGRSLGEISWDRTIFPYRMLDSNLTMAELLKDAGFKTAAFVTHRYLGRQWNYTQGFDHVDESLVLRESIYRSRATGKDLVKKANRWLEQHAKERFYLHVHLMDPHKRYLKHQDLTDWGNSPIDLYDSEIEYCDREIGNLLDKLDQLGISDTTTVLIISDHGEFFGEHGRTAHGGCVWEEGNRIPILIRSPGLKPHVSRCLTPHTDLAPTLLNLVGIDGGKHGMSGSTLLPEMAGAACDPQREIVVEMRYGARSAPNLRALVGTRWKLVLNVKRGTYRLYDLENDPQEKRNVARSNKQIYREMRERLTAWSDVYANREIAEIRKQVVIDALPPEAERMDIRFANGLELVAVDFGDRQVNRDSPLDVKFYLRSGVRIREDCQIYHYLVNEEGDVVYEEGHAPITGTFPLRYWPLDELVVDGFALETRSGKIQNSPDVRVNLRCGKDWIPAVTGEVDGKGRASIGALQITARQGRVNDSVGRK